MGEDVRFLAGGSSYKVRFAFGGPNWPNFIICNLNVVIRIIIEKHNDLIVVARIDSKF